MVAILLSFFIAPYYSFSILLVTFSKTQPSRLSETIPQGHPGTLYHLLESRLPNAPINPTTNVVTDLQDLHMPFAAIDGFGHEAS